MKKSDKVIVKNKMGLHTRPATAIVKLLRTCRSQVFFTCNRKTVNAKSILSILMLAARKDTPIKITAEGEDAEEVLEKLKSAFDNEFGDAF